jgi:hypothetical protein
LRTVFWTQQPSKSPGSSVLRQAEDDLAFLIQDSNRGIPNLWRLNEDSDAALSITQLEACRAGQIRNFGKAGFLSGC